MILPYMTYLQSMVIPWFHQPFPRRQDIRWSSWSRAPAGSAKAPAEARIGAAEAFTGGLAHFKRDLVLKHFFKHSKKDKKYFFECF